MNGSQVLRRLEGRPAGALDRPATPPARHPRVRRLFRAAVDAALVAVLAGILFIGAGLVGTPWYSLVTIEGGSMAPAISRGDLILVAPAPAKVEPGMILVLRVGGEVVTHRVVAVEPDGTIITRGDANGVDDAWGGQQVAVMGQYLATVPMLGRFLPVGTASEASFADAVRAGMTITVGPFPAPGNLAATVRIEPQTINLKGKANGEISGFVDSLPAPHALSEIDLSSVQLCYMGACIPSDGPAALDGQAPVAAKFDRAALAKIVGTDSGDLTLVIQGSLLAGGTFSGSDVNRVMGSRSNGLDAPIGDAPGDPSAPIDSPTPTDPPVLSSQPPVLAPDPPAPSPDPPVLIAPPSPDPSASPDPSPSPVDTTSPAPTDTSTPAPTDTPAPTVTPAPTDTSSPAPAGG